LSEFPLEWRWVAALNPMTPIVETFRLLLLGVGTVEPLHIVSSIATTAVVTVAGLILFSRIEKTFVDII
jgi:lipopolysaccharide transport system permease protein